ncbi:MAG: PTS glucose transporter subunit IIA, partial [Promicromonosporaceae bacterium]|nr:PTS glucose transporter subunit IIA [Promicromonosporaceae bacterium]
MLDVIAPVAGTVVGLADVPDPVFAEGMVGPGMAVLPNQTASCLVSAPITGRLLKLHPHAFIVASTEALGRGVLVHLGIDTVELRGEGFTMLATEGDDVVAGQPIVEWNPAVVEASGRSPIVPVIALDTNPTDLTPLAAPA